MISKGYKGVGMEGSIARRYDKMARENLGEVYRAWAEKISQRLQDNDAVLEIAPGPGLLAIELARLRPLKISGLEISRTFLELARANAQEARVDIEFREGDVASMPYPDEAFDFIFCTSAFNNFADPQKALNEICRVLKCGATVWIRDLRHDASDAAVHRYVRNEMKMSGVIGIFMRYLFKRKLRPHALTKAQFEVLLSRTSFRETAVTENDIDWEALLEK